jgi:hypothetical protein
VWLGISTVEAGMWTEVGKAACWIELDYVALGLSCLKLDSSIRSWDAFSTSGCRFWNIDHYSVPCKKGDRFLELKIRKLSLELRRS